MKGSGRCKMIFNGGFLKSPLWIFWVFTVWLAAWNPVSESDAAEVTDDFIQGYVTAIVAMSYPGQVGPIQVKNGVVYVEQSRLSEEEKTDLGWVISDIKGVKKVRFILNKKYPQKVLAAETDKEETASLDGSLPVFLPETQLFRPLIAAPRWPRFSASYQPIYERRFAYECGIRQFRRVVRYLSFSRPLAIHHGGGHSGGCFFHFRPGC